MNLDQEVSNLFTAPPNPPDPLQCVRECYKKKPQTALLILDKTLQAEKDNPSALLERAKVYNHLQRYGEALYDLTKFLQFDHHNMEAYQLRAHLYFQMKKYKNSLRDIEICINRIESQKTEEENFQYTPTDLESYELRGN